MNAKQVCAEGGRYQAKVSNTMTTVELHARIERRRGKRNVTRFRGVNIRTGRKVELSAAKLRRPCPEWEAFCRAEDERMKAKLLLTRQVCIEASQTGVAPSVIRDRIEAARAEENGSLDFPSDPTPLPVTMMTGVVKIAVNEDKGGIEVTFPGKPPEAVRNDLKAFGFRYSRFHSVWWAKNQGGGMLETITSLLTIWNEKGQLPAVATA